MNNEDTIVGISTAFGKGAISIVRLSGNEAIKIVNKFFKGSDLLSVLSHTIHYGLIINPISQEVIDEVLVSVFLAPKTYTKENIVEINCHGGIFVTNQIFELAVLNGARVAEAGEFTKRAFLNGRIDLTKAEAVMDIIDAESKSALKLATKGLMGDVLDLIENKRRKLLDIIAHIAVNIDYPEYDDVKVLTNEIIKPKIEKLNQELKEILKRASDAQKLKNGIDTVIVGRPNVGKSSLLNALLREDRAIVTPLPGTTRDVIEGKLHLSNIVLNLIDTAGIREATDEIEKIGISKSKSKLEEAELVLLIFDGSEPLNNEDYALLELISSRPHLKIVNKVDLPLKIDMSQIPDALLISTYNKKDILILEEKIKKFVMVSDINIDQLTYISNARQLGKINEAVHALDDALLGIEKKIFIDFIDIYLQEAWHYLGEVIGEVKDDQLIDELFSRFCLGK